MIPSETDWRPAIIAAILALGGCESHAPGGLEGAHESAGAGTHEIHWGYDAENGPEIWADLSLDYSLCRDGVLQSPIDLRDAEPRPLPQLTRAYQPASLRIIRHEHVVDVIDNGHTIQVNSDDGSVLRIGDAAFELAQFHFHAPSEHTVIGRHSPMEMHLVHQSDSGELAVIGVLIEEGSHNAAFEPVWADLPDEVGEEIHLEHIAVDIDDLLPTSHRSYRYMGSLTTPPCSEGVSWLVFAEPIQLSTEQIRAFTEIIHENNRPVQPRGARAVLIDQTDEK